MAHGFQNAAVDLVQDEEYLSHRVLGTDYEEHEEVEEEEQHDDNFLDEHKPLTDKADNIRLEFVQTCKNVLNRFSFWARDVSSFDLEK